MIRAVSILIIAPLLVLYLHFNTITICAYDYTNISTYPYITLLNEDEIIVYRQIYSNILSFNSQTFNLEKPISESRLEDTMNALFNDHPELFWVYTAYQYGVDSSGIVHKVKLKFCLTKADYPQAKANYDAILDELVKGAKTFNSQLDQERYLHDAICQMNTYDPENHLNQSSYSALASGSSVCAGYSRAFQAACQKLGITCYYVTGTSRGSTHAWNVVMIDGKFYNVDLTWDDCISEATGGNSYIYFNKSDSTFNRDHQRSVLSMQIASCD